MTLMMGQKLVTTTATEFRLLDHFARHLDLDSTSVKVHPDESRRFDLGGTTSGTALTGRSAASSRGSRNSTPATR
jgi:pyruvate dehydrogenase complex dehydrogenase (E1) component